MRQPERRQEPALVCRLSVQDCGLRPDMLLKQSHTQEHQGESAGTGIVLAFLRGQVNTMALTKNDRLDLIFLLTLIVLACWLAYQACSQPGEA